MGKWGPSAGKSSASARSPEKKVLERIPWFFSSAKLQVLMVCPQNAATSGRCRGPEGGSGGDISSRSASCPSNQTLQSCVWDLSA